MVLLLCPLFLAAQLSPSRLSRSYTQINDTLVLDSLSLVPGSLSWQTFPGDSVYRPRISYQLHALIFKKRPDSLLVSYQRFPHNFEKVYFHKDANDLYVDMSRRRGPFEIQYNKPGNNPLFENDALNKNGNISRGISFGNNQDIVLNSNLNLQVSGKLSPDIDLLMAATDNNIPFQADGTTAQLQEFDKVYIQLNNQQSKLVVGDYQLSRPSSSYFMNFYKRAQGGLFESTYRDSSLKKPLTFKTQVGAAVSRGKFSRQVFFGVENNQGPYRLKGSENEPFIIVLSGTEKIYIDGRILQRGQENDYIIDYNTGELTFTARQIMTKDKRIVAEFQYAERNYARSLFFFGEEVKSKKSTVYLNFFSEQDNKNRPLQQILSQDQKNSLIDIGDSLSQAFYTGATEQVFSSNAIYYSKRDTLVSDFIYPNVYVYTTVADSVNYVLKFSYVGEQKGNYVRRAGAANGQVYTWVAPIGNVPAGNYEPVIPLVTPKQNQMLVTGVTHTFNAAHQIAVEGVYTKNDVNTFSGRDKRNDEGSGLKIISRNQEVLASDSAGQELKIIYHLNYEFLQQRFQQIERFRSIEFDRDWNRPLTSKLSSDQHLLSAEAGLLKTGKAGLSLNYGLFQEGTSYSGRRQGLSANFGDRQVQALYNGSYLLTEDPALQQNTHFYRHRILLSRQVDRLKFSYSDDFENNQFINSGSNLLLPRSYQFYEWEGSVANVDSTKNKVKLFYKRRLDKLNYGNELKDSTSAENIGMQASLYGLKNNPLTVLITYRKLSLRNVVGNSLRPDNTLLNRVEYNPRYWKGLITAGVFYETGYGLENKRDYYYLEVAPGQGQYAWNDYNGNSLRERNEFEVALYRDQMRFIRIYTPTNEYVKVLQNQLSLSFSLRPSAVMKGAGKTAVFLRRWALQTALRLDNKVNDNNSLDNFNPFVIPRDSLLLASNNNIRHSLFFNQSSPIFGADYTYIDNRARQLLTNGIEEKKIFSQQIRWRLNFLKAWSLNGDQMLSRKSNVSQFFGERNYQIRAIQIEEKLGYQLGTVFRLSAIYKYEDKRNISGDRGQKALLNTYALELKYNQTEKGVFTGRADWIRIRYNATLNTAVAYEMLNGLSAGENFTWELGYQRNLNSNMQISINYSGRKTPAAPIVNLGGAQIRAFF